MARGWESKSVEVQQEEASRTQGGSGRPVTVEERDRQQRRRTLELARARATADLARATTDAHRAMIEQSIADLDALLGAL
jgi:hypothetical protein